MRTRLVGLGIMAIGLAFAWFFVYLPIRDGAAGFMGPLRVRALVFVPLAVVTGLAFAIGGPPVYKAFQVGKKTRAELTLVLSLLVVSGVLSGVGYWQIKSRWLSEPEPVIIDVKSIPKPPSVPNR